MLSKPGLTITCPQITFSLLPAYQRQQCFLATNMNLQGSCCATSQQQVGWQLHESCALTGGKVRYCSAICTRSSGKFCDVGDPPLAAGPLLKADPCSCCEKSGELCTPTVG